MKTYRLSSTRVVAALLFIALMAVLYLTSRAAPVQGASTILPAVNVHGITAPAR